MHLKYTKPVLHTDFCITTLSIVLWEYYTAQVVLGNFHLQLFSVPGMCTVMGPISGQGACVLILFRQSLWPAWVGWAILWRFPISFMTFCSGYRPSLFWICRTTQHDTMGHLKVTTCQLHQDSGPHQVGNTINMWFQTQSLILIGRIWRVLGIAWVVRTASVLIGLFHLVWVY